MGGCVLNTSRPKIVHLIHIICGVCPRLAAVQGVIAKAEEPAGKSTRAKAVKAVEAVK